MFTNKYPKINFIGNKEKLSSWICENIPKDVESVLDAFCGGGSMSYSLKKRGYQVFSNDILRINHLINKALIENNNIILTQNDVEQIFIGQPYNGFMSKNYSNSLFFEQECQELDLYRKNIANLKDEFKQALALILIRRAMIRKMPYSRFNIKWDKVKELRNEELSYEKYGRRRAYHNKSFQYHFLDNLNDYNNAVFDNNKLNKSFNSDIFSLLDDRKIKTDLIYLDPPYVGTMNNYFSFYGVMDEYITGKKQTPFENNFTNKEVAITLFNRLFSKLNKFKYCMLSYNNNSYPSEKILTDILSQYSKDIQIVKKQHNYQITGKENKKKNEECLFIVKL